MFRVVEEIARLAQLDDLAGIHHGQPVGEVADQGHVVGDEEGGEADLALQLLDLQHQRALSDHVEG